MDEKIYEEHARTVYYFLLSLCHNPHTAQDLTQETFLRAYQSIDRFDGFRYKNNKCFCLG